MHLLRSHDSPNAILWWWWSGSRFIQVLIYCGGSVNLLYGIPRRQDNWNQIKLSALPLYMESPLFIYFSLGSSGDHCKQWILWCSIQIDSISHVILSTTNRSDVACSYKQQTKVLCKALALVYIYQHISLHVGRKSDQITRGWDGTITFYLPTRCYPWQKKIMGMAIHNSNPLILWLENPFGDGKAHCQLSRIVVSHRRSNLRHRMVIDSRVINNSIPIQSLIDSIHLIKNRLVQSQVRVRNPIVIQCRVLRWSSPSQVAVKSNKFKFAFPFEALFCCLPTGEINLAENYIGLQPQL